MYERLILAGSGGQGIMTISKVLARAAMLSDLNCTYFPSYGTEVRGGTANCQVIISDEEIYSPIVEAADTLFAMNDPSYRRFRMQLKPGGLLVVNTSMAKVDETDARGQKPEARGQRAEAGNPKPETRNPKPDVLAIPASELANGLGDVRVANTILLGAYNARRKIVADDLLFEQLSYAFGGLTGRLLALNRAAYQAGAQYGGAGVGDRG